MRRGRTTCPCGRSDAIKAASCWKWFPSTTHPTGHSCRSTTSSATRRFITATSTASVRRSAASMRGADGELVEIDGYAIFTRSYDDVGNITQETLFGRDGQPAAGGTGGTAE